MLDKHLYEYATLRLVPCVDRGEFINVGIALYCKSPRFLGFKFKLDESRLKAFASQLDFQEIKEHLVSFQKICEASKDAGLIGEQDMPSRFRWLTARRSTILQASEVHPGYCNSPEETLDTLFQKMVN